MDANKHRNRAIPILIATLLLALVCFRLGEQSSSRKPDAPAPGSSPAWNPGPLSPKASPAQAGQPSQPPAPADAMAADGTSPGPSSPVSQFNDWLDRYFAAPDSIRSGLRAQGEELAARRRGFLFDLIRDHPEAALAAAVPMRLRPLLPESVRSLLEERLSGRGALGVLVATDFDRGVRQVRREVVLNGRQFDAFVYGRRLAQPTRNNVVLHGIAVGNRLAVHANPVRRLEPGEAAPAATGRELCPVSSRPTKFQGAEALAEVAGRIEQFCAPAHVELLDRRLAADDGLGGEGGEPPLAEDSWSQGPKTCLFMRVAFPDDPAEPITEDGAYVLMDGVNQWFVENSYDTTSIIPTVTPLLLLPQTKAWYGAQGTGRLMADARDAAREAGYDTDNYHWDIVRHGSVPGFNWGGLAFVRGKGTWLQNSSVGVAVHELGHNYGLWHANAWTGAGDSVIGPGAHTEYGNNFDTMGAASAGNNQFNAAFKHQLDWLPEPFVQAVTASGTWRLRAFDAPSIATGLKYALRVKKNYDRNYWVEFRQKFTSNRWLSSGVLLNWDPWNNGVTNSAGGTHLLDATPGTPDGRIDGAVVVGRTFSDPAAGLHLTPVARGADGFGNWIDVTVNLGEFPDNAPPAAALTADRLAVNTNEPVNFVANAVDPDGDALAFAWDFGDGTFGPNAPVAAKSWGAPGDYAVRCAVSDMKGGVASRHLVVTVGAPAVFRVSGRILAADGSPIEGVRVHNGGTGAAYRGAYTDSDGDYTLVNLPAGATTLYAVKYGYALARAGWPNPVTLGPDASGLDWTATPDPRVRLVASAPSANEAGLIPGRFTFTRVGATNLPLVVKFNRSGSAFFTTDYTNDVSITGSPLRVTIPAGALSLDLAIHPVPDTVTEGPETVTLSLMEDTAYVLGGPAEATVTIIDAAAPSLPVVSVSATSPSGLADNLAPESGPDSGAFVFTRSGNAAGELVVWYAASGAATAGADYAPLPGVAVIPAGETATAVSFRVLDDTEVETNEPVVVTVLANPAYTLGAVQAAIVIVDDDPTTITVSATDELARESGGNNATFTVTRQGSLAANLVVNYTLGGTASNGVDYSALSGAVTLPAGRATATITLSPLNDSLPEGEETVTLVLSNTASCNIGNPATATVTLVDDEHPGVTLTASDGLAGESPGDDGAFLFARTGGTTADLIVRFRVDGSASAGADYAPLMDSILIPAGASNITLFVTPVDDGVKEADETVRVTLLPDAAYSVNTAGPQTVTVRDNDPGLPGVGFTFAASSASEGRSTAYLSVSLSTNSGSAVTVNYAVTGGSATAGADYTLSAGTLSIPAGAVNRSVTLFIASDAEVETNETILITLSNPTNALLDAFPTHELTILDDDGAGTVSVSAPDPDAAETGPDPGVFRLTRSGPSNLAATVFFQVVGAASSPGDFAPLGSSATIPAGSNALDLVVSPVDDDTDETNEAVVLNLLPSPGVRLGNDTAVVFIEDNDDHSGLPVVSVAATDPEAAEPGADTGEFIFLRSGDTNAPLTVQFTVGGSAASGSDYTAFGTSVIIPAGAHEATVSVVPRNDAAFETNETVIVTLTVLPDYQAGSAVSAQVAIVDDETAVAIAAVRDASEDGVTAGEFLVSRTGSTASNLTVQFSVAGTAGTNDYTPLAAPLVIPAGTNAAPLPVLALDDALAEGNESVVVTIAPGAGYALSAASNAVVLVLDDEPVVSVTAADPQAYEGDGDPGAFLLTRTGGTGQPLEVFFLISGTASNGVDYALLTNSAVMDAGQSSRAVTVLPLDDAATEGGETVRLTLLPGAGYSVLAPGPAVVTLVDDESNLRPVVSIPSPATNTVFLAGTNNALVLEAIATDDHRPVPPGALAVAWSAAGRPGPVLFEDVASTATTARFIAEGDHVIRFTASDGELSAFLELTVVIGPTNPPPNLAPLVDAGTNQTVPQAVGAALAGFATDDGLPAPPGALAARWSQVNGPGEALFANETSPATTVTFTDGGVYVLRLTADDGQVKTSGDVTITVIAPTVISVLALEPAASEFGEVFLGEPPFVSQGAFGVFIISREGGAGEALLVNLSVGGTAHNGTDYVAIGDTVLMPEGENEVVIFVAPIRDALAEGAETVVLTVAPGPDYLLGTSSQDVVTIADTPWDDWRFARFNADELANPAVSGELADPDGDGLNNLLEYSCNRNPRLAEPAGATPCFRGAIEPLGGIGNPGGGTGQGTGFVVTYPQRVYPTDLYYEVEVTSDFVTWHTGFQYVRLLRVTDDGNGVTETVRAQVLPQPGVRQQFARLRILRL
jgi:hypothetical protein